uniref:MADF domain-containing protein n=2 Tax=Caenorhabditis japonica TaxID=281687 RepID=A0A8R1HQV4_CAEJA
MNEYHEDSPSQDSLEDEFIHALIDSVQKNPCVFNRYDPLHKVTEYKHEIWKMIAVEIGYDGHPVELERKWKHMRDKYVRLRKMDKQKAPIKKTNKWYNYYHKMSFLDPYVEHRNRKRQKGFDDIDDLAFLDDFSVKEFIKRETGSISPHSSSTSSGNLNQNADSPSDTIDEERKKLILQLLADNVADKAPSLVTINASPSEVVTEQRSSRKRKPIPTQIIQEDSPSPPPKMVSKSSVVLEDPLKALDDETQVTYFIRSLSKSLLEMDRKKFAIARIEISKLLYNIENDKIQYPDGAI